MSRNLGMSLMTQIILLVCIVVATALMVTSFLISNSIAKNVEESIGKNALDIARIVAKMPIVVDGLMNNNEDENIQKMADEIVSSTNVTLVVVADMNGIRKSHPDRSKIGLEVVGDDTKAVFNGEEYYSIGEGTLGYSMRAFCPVYSSEGIQVGMVAVGVILDDVQKVVSKNREIIYTALMIGLLIGLTGAMLLARNIKKRLLGLEPHVIARMLNERIAMINSVREGIIAVNKNGIITLANSEAMRIFRMAGIKENIIGKYIADDIISTRLIEVIHTGQAQYDQEQEINGITIITNRTPIIVKNQVVGAIATFREKKEVWQMAEELIGVKSYIEALRTQNHEFMNKLHVILGMVRLQSYEQLNKYINIIVQNQEDETKYVGNLIKDPVIAGLILSKLSKAREQGVEISLDEKSMLPEVVNPHITHEIVVILGNLIDNAIEALQTSPVKRLEVTIRKDNGALLLKVGDAGPGIKAQWKEEIFRAGFSTKPGKRGRGLALVRQSVQRLKGEITVESEEGKGACFRIILPFEE